VVTPGGVQAGLVPFFEEWLGAPYPVMRADRALLMPLIEHPDGLGARPAGEHRSYLAGLAGSPLGPALRRFSVLAAAAYATTPAGFSAIGFVGNEPRASFDGPPPAVLARLDAEFAKLEFPK